MRVITADNIGTILTILISTTGLYFLRELFKNFWKWRKGASYREREVIQFTLDQLEKCHDDLEVAENERDAYRRQVGRRDHVILAAGLQLPRDTRRGEPGGPVGRTQPGP